MECVGQLDPDHAEEQPGRIPHDPPGTNLLHPGRPELFESRHLGVDIVGLDVEVDPRRRCDALNVELQSGRDLPHVGVVRVDVVYFGLDAEGVRPEPRLPLEIGRRDVDQGGHQPAFVHVTNGNRESVW